MNWVTDKSGTRAEVGDRRYIVCREMDDFVKRTSSFYARVIALRGNGSGQGFGYFPSREAAMAACEIYEQGRSK